MPIDNDFLRLKLLRFAPKQRNSRKFSLAKISRYTVSKSHMLNKYWDCPHDYTSTCTHVLTSVISSKKFLLSFGGELTPGIVGGTGAGGITGANGSIPDANEGGG